jgi:hypothetical protein
VPYQFGDAPIVLSENRIARFSVLIGHRHDDRCAAFVPSLLRTLEEGDGAIELPMFGVAGRRRVGHAERGLQCRPVPERVQLGRDRVPKIVQPQRRMCRLAARLVQPCPSP